MNNKEVKRCAVIGAAVENKCTVAEAALRLGISERRIKQLKKTFKEKGVSGIVHGNTVAVSPKKTSTALVERVIELRMMAQLKHSNYTHFHEIITEGYNVPLCYSTVSRILNASGFTSPKKRRRKKIIHKTRERKACSGMMLQADASPHCWLGTKDKYSLHGFIDDATGAVTGLYLCKNECLLGYLEVLRQTLTGFGIPLSLYPDKHSVFFVNPKHTDNVSIDEQLAGIDKKLTQFGRIVEHLGIDMFAAQSPEAKGRIERLWQTLQSRLPVEFALRGIQTMEEANSFLNDYIRQYNKQFAHPASDTHSCFIPVPHTEDLERLLCSVITRKLSSGSTISIMNTLFLIEQNSFPAKTTVDVLISQKHGLRALINGSFYPIFPLDKVTYAKTVVRTGDMPQVLVDLIEHYLLKDAKCA